MRVVPQTGGRAMPKYIVKLIFVALFVAMVIFFLILGGCEVTPDEDADTKNYVTDTTSQPPQLQDNVDLNIPYYSQACSNWCWAAVISMVTDYFGTGQYQCDLAGGLAIYLTGLPLNCCAYDACMYDNSPCNQTIQGDMLMSFLQNQGIRGVWSYNTITEEQLKQELRERRPVILGIHGYYLGHAVLVTGFNTQNGTAIFHVSDPIYGVAYVNYTTLVYGYNGGTAIWTETGYQISR